MRRYLFERQLPCNGMCEAVVFRAVTHAITQHLGWLNTVLCSHRRVLKVHDNLNANLVSKYSASLHIKSWPNDLAVLNVPTDVSAQSIKLVSHTLHIQRHAMQAPLPLSRCTARSTVQHTRYGIGWTHRRYISIAFCKRFWIVRPTPISSILHILHICRYHNIRYALQYNICVMIWMDTQTFTHRCYISIAFCKRSWIVHSTLVSPILHICCYHNVRHAYNTTYTLWFWWTHRRLHTDFTYQLHSANVMKLSVLHWSHQYWNQVMENVLCHYDAAAWSAL